MGKAPQRGPVIFTNKARCRDCYRCVRVCPVKAIRVQNGQASIVEERCIGCGTCLRECPQRAKAVRDDTSVAKELLASGYPVAASVAPSYVAAFAPWERRRLPSALRRLGFSYVGETAVGARAVAVATTEAWKESGRDCIASSCPAVVGMVEKYFPELAAELAPVVSPMLAHAKHIRESLGQEAKVVFIGPCVAKKVEADRSRAPYKIDCALTFYGLRAWLEAEHIDLKDGEESPFDEEAPADARVFPLEGGSIRTAGLSTDMLSGEIVAVSGAEAVREALESMAKKSGDSQLKGEKGMLLEALFCPRGCICGPASGCEASPLETRREVLAYASELISSPIAEAVIRDVSTSYLAAPADTKRITEEMIRNVLARTGKLTEADELNCGACGYASCRDKAVAVIRGMAEPEMCIPYMRRLAERRSDRIIDTSPNGIVLLDDQLRILEANASFRKMFSCSEAVLGRPISYLMDPDPFEKAALAPGEVLESEVEDARSHLIFQRLVYAIPGDRQLVGIFINQTDTRRNQDALERLQAETSLQAQELLRHQIEMAQRMASFLGESTAQGEALVEKLLNLAGAAAEARKSKPEGFQPWPTSTST